MVIAPKLHSSTCITVEANARNYHLRKSFLLSSVCLDQWFAPAYNGSKRAEGFVFGKDFFRIRRTLDPLAATQWQH